ncbi:MAG TPA: hypothetical protein PLO65_16215 [Caulobacter sp.]|nr:hypothetical protein [Caulobacter sp.]
MMSKVIAAAAAAILLAGGGVALAQDSDVSEIVVTGSRMMDYEPTETPAIVLRKRADNVLTSIEVTCDTRDPAQRKAELKTTLQALIRGAAAAGIELAVESDDIVRRFNPDDLDAIIRAASKADTSTATLTLKTRVQPTDSFESVTGRVAAFVKKTPKTGRTEVLMSNDWDLTLVGPGQYRGDIIALVAADANRTAAAFGPAYSVSIDGLTLPVSWYQSGPLELALYIPYRQAISK